MTYYMILLFCIWAIVGLALSQWSRGEQGGLVARILLAGALMSFLHFLLIIVALLDRQNGTALVQWSPPLERLVDTLSALLICWAFVVDHGQTRQQQTLSRATVGAIGLFSLGFYVFSAAQWTGILRANPRAVYNLTTQRWVWELWQLVFMVPALAYLIAAPATAGSPRERDALGASLGALIVGHLLQIIFPMAEQIPHAAAWVRFANLIAFPLLSIATYRLIIQQFDVQADDLETVNKRSLARITNLMTLLDVNEKLSSSLDLDTVLRNAIQEVAQVLRSDLCALALFSPTEAGQDAPSPPDEMKLAIVYDAPHTLLENRRFRWDQYPAIQHAVTQKEAMVIEPESASGQARPIAFDTDSDAALVYRLLQSEQQGPLIVQPLLVSSTVTGAILACRPEQRSPFTPTEVKRCETIATHLGTAIENARRYQQSQSLIRQLLTDKSALQTEHARIRTDLQNRLAKSEDQATVYMQKLYEAELGEQQAQEHTQQIRRELARQRKDNQIEIAHARDEVKRSIQQAAHLTQQMAELDAKCLELANLVQVLEQEKGLLQLRLAVAATEQAELDLGQDRLGLGQAELGLAAAERSADRLVPQEGLFAQAVDEQKRIRDSLFVSLTHHLRTPMTAIIGYIELLRNGSLGQLNDEQRRLLHRVQANVERLKAMANNLVGIAAIDSGNLVIEPASIDVASQIEVALERAKFRMAEKELKTRIEIDAVPPIHADPEYTQQILDNLMSNAVKASQAGTEIGIKAFAEDDPEGVSTLHVVISDTGAGIALEDQAQVFERFYHADKALIAGLGENGVGLSLVKTLVEAHQGQVWCASEPGAGAAFHLTMPIDSNPLGGRRGDGRD
jgi:signal transduction histidine kinase